MLLILVLVLAVVALIVLGIAVLEVALDLLWWALIGLVIGALGRLLVPGRQAIGLIATALLGVAGALLGGVIADALDVGRFLQFVIAVLVSAALIAIYSGFARRDDSRRAREGELRLR